MPATIVSLLPYDVIEPRPGMVPREVVIAKAEGNAIGLTIVEDGFYMLNPDPLSDAKEVKFIKVPVIAMQLAQSVINDYISATFGAQPPDAMPGLMALEGRFTDRKEVNVKFLKELMVLREQQNNWWRNLINDADDMWAKTHSPNSISDMQRRAAEMLELKRDWLAPLSPELVTRCPICKAPINEGALKCASCQTVLNQKEYDKVIAATSK